MVSRRAMLGTSTVGGLLASLAPAAAAEPAGVAAAQRGSEEAIQDVTKAIRDLRDEMKRQTDFWELASLRDPIRMFLRTSGKFPDFVEVGVDIWQQVYDWHIRHLQQPTIGRNAEGRYTIMLMATMLVMRVEAQPTFIGIPFDNR